MPDNGTQLSYTFLGVDENPVNGAYTPLIVPGSSVGTIEETNVAQPTSTVDVNGNNKEQQRNSTVTPFSKIRNYQFEKIKAGNLDSIRQEYVNVVKDYIWTISPKSSRNGEADVNKYKDNNYRNVNDEVPYIILKEKYFLVNNLIAQALYTLSATLEDSGVTGATTTGASNIAGATTEIGKSLLGKIVNLAEFSGVRDFITTESSEQINQTGVAGIVDTVFQSISNTVKETADIKQIFEKYNNPDLEKVLFPYQKLYIVGPTGFTYKLPFLSNTVLNTINSFSGANNENVAGILTGIVDKLPSVAETILGTFKVLAQAGSARIERTKYYQYPTEGQPIEVTLPLYNTRPATYGDICNNFKLVLLLLYQNLPLRQDKVIIEPPVLYDVTIPGNRREPYCYVSSLVINHRGSTRMMEINLAGVSNSGGGNDVKLPDTIKTIIPDMYEIKLTLQPMVASSKNLLFTTIQEDVVRADFATGEFLNSQIGGIPNNANITDFGAIG